MISLYEICDWSDDSLDEYLSPFESRESRVFIIYLNGRDGNDSIALCRLVDFNNSSSRCPMINGHGHWRCLTSIDVMFYLETFHFIYYSSQTFLAWWSVKTHISRKKTQIYHASLCNHGYYGLHLRSTLA